MMTKILIIEDEPLIARDLKRIAINCGYEVMNICYNSDKALDALALLNYNLILLDINLKGTRNGIELAEIINKKYFKPFIFITSYADKATIESVKKTNPAGYVIKPFTNDEIFSAIEIGIFKSNQLKKNILSITSLNSRFGATLTPKEFSILQDLVSGYANAQIASKYFISLNTVKGHIKNVYSKLDTHSRAETVGKVLSYDS